MWKTGSHWLLIDQLINRQKSHSYLHFQAIFLSMSFESATNCNPCENRTDIQKMYCQDIVAFGYINISYIF